MKFLTEAPLGERVGRHGRRVSESGLRRAGMLTVAALLLGALWGAGVATAASPEWMKGGAPLIKASAFESKIETMIFTQANTGLEINCHGVSGGAAKTAGTVGPGAVGEITGVTTSSGSHEIACEELKSGSCLSPVHIEALRLPWKTELVTVSGEIRYEIKSGSKGETPQWKITCGEPRDYELCENKTSYKTANSPEGLEAFSEYPSGEVGVCSSGGNNLVGVLQEEIVGYQAK